MPTYEYECDACGHRFDQFQSITAKTLRKCPECGRLKLRRLIGTGGAVIFKGGGFYETDYRSEGYRKAEEADRTSTEAKPAAASETTSGGSSGHSGDPGKTEPSKAASGKAGDSTTGSSGSSSSGASGDAAGASKRSAGSADRGASAAGAAGTSGPAKKASGKRHAREGRGVGNLKTTSRSRSTKKSTRRPRG